MPLRPRRSHVMSHVSCSPCRSKHRNSRKVTTIHRSPTCNRAPLIAHPNENSIINLIFHTINKIMFALAFARCSYFALQRFSTIMVSVLMARERDWRWVSAGSRIFSAHIPTRTVTAHAPMAQPLPYGAETALCAAVFRSLPKIPI